MKQTKDTLKARAHQRRQHARALARQLYQNCIREGFVPSRAKTSDLLPLVYLERRLRPIFETARREVTERFDEAKRQRRRQQREAAGVFHPSTFLADELKARGWSLRQLAMLIGGDVEREYLALRFWFLQNDGIRLGEEGAANLARVLGTSVELWTNLEQAWLEGVARVDEHRRKESKA